MEKHHNARCLHVSRVKAIAVYFFKKKTYNVKTRQLILRKGAGIW